MMAHALSTEQQEVMGLLLGSWFYDELGVAKRADIAEVVTLQRSDRRPDRVEVSGAQLAQASDVAEAKGHKVIGWYHSHPHITVAPSHVDARTQGQYQTLDDGFVGLICAVFQEGDSAMGSVRVVAFQSEDVANEPGGFADGSPPAYDDVVSKKPLWRPREIPVDVTRQGSSVPHLRALANLQDALFEEERAARRKHADAFFADAVFRKGVALLATDSLHPLIHVVASKLAAQHARCAAAKAKLALLRPPNYDDL
ncbi:hypothetical protein CTAYLR_005650 [Chrysophaeum taylorii]|uniref:MPN domain-containing protein n=1 Tax=Chrysophaeum taylorii TaxID=2483200 RepID=A0AAD7UM97_9STRA|nr:hypothetical protein CTAYLR_005650 [Chrysophaeum taylorii]